MTICALLAACTLTCASVDPMIGTEATGHAFPGPCRPFGLVQPSPDTGNGSWRYCAGYAGDDRAIRRFSQTHLNGTGQAGLGDVAFLPFTGELPADVTSLTAAFAKEREHAELGRYRVELADGIQVSIAAGRRLAKYRIVFPTGKKGGLFFDFPYGLYREKGYLKHLTTKCEVEKISNRRLRGINHSEVWAPRDIAYVVAFDRDADAVVELPRGASDKGPRHVAWFNGGGTVEVSIAVSARSIAGAERNFDAEAGKSFETLVDETRTEWAKLLERVDGTGLSDEERRTRATAVYHLFIQPNVVSDVGEPERYSTFSLWDTFRDAHPLYEKLVPEKVPAFVDSLLAHYREHGYLPQWELWGRETGGMIGSHAVPVIVDAYEHGFKGFDPEEAYRAVKATLTVSTRPGKGVTYPVRTDWEILDQYGYYPFDLVKRESVSRTLECCYDDFRAAAFARALGKAEDAAFFERRSWSFTNLFDRTTCCFRGKDSKGRWREPFNPAGLSCDFTEGSALQWSWYVLHRPEWLVAAMGGREAFGKRLDAFFAGTLCPGADRGHSQDVTGLIGDYAHGNEPCHHVIDLYRLIGRNDTADALTRRVFNEFYRPTPGGLCGNDDCGQMSAWYLRRVPSLPVIVLPDAPTAVERSAAAELAEGLGRVLGKAVATVAEKNAETADGTERTQQKGTRFFVGATRASRAARGNVPWKTDGVFLKSVPGGIVLDGEPTRAPIYAVDLYLEKYCGVRWWTSTASTCPHLDAAPVDGIDLDYAPPFAYRETYYLDGFDPKFKVRSKGNFSSLTRYMLTDMAFIPPELGGNHRLYFFKGRHSAYHSFFEILPPATHFKAHPEWYSLVKGKRTPKQLCLANAEMKKAYIAETLRRLREDSSVDFIQVSQNDWYGSCECAACKALEAEDGGVPSGPYLRFANEVAEAVEKEFPKVRIDTFAYQFTRRAPAKTRPRHNVVVRLCDIECDFSTPLAECRQKANAAFVKDLADWSRVAPGRLFIWDYLADFHSYMIPHPNIFSIAPNIRLFAANGATGVYEQGDALCSAGTFAPLRHYLTSHLLWNPKLDALALIHEFLAGYYGKSAAPHLAKAIDRIETAAHAKQAFVGCGHAKAPFLTVDEALDADAHFAAALEAAKKDGEKFAARVRREALSMDHLFLLEWHAYKARAAERKLPWRRCQTRAGAVERWISACEDFGVLTHRETVTRKTYTDYIAKLRKEAGCRAWELGETYQRTRLPSDRRLWHVALEAEEHDFSHRARTLTDARGVYKLNHESKLACLVLKKTEKAGDSWDEDLGVDGKLHVQWTRKANGAIDYTYTAPTNWDVFVTAYPGAVSRWGVKVMKSRTGTNDPMPSVTLPEGWRVVKGEEHSGVNVREAYLTFEKDGVGLPPPQVALAWPGVGVRAVYGASNVVVTTDGATFVPSGRKPPTSFGTGLPKKGVISSSLTHHVRGMQAGPHRNVPYPENEIRAVRNFVFAMRDALGRLGFDKDGSMEHGGLWLGGFDSNFPNGHTDFPAHFHICVPCRDGNQVHHFYMRPEDGRITWDCHQDMSKVMDIWDRVFKYVPGDTIPVYDGCGRIAFTAKMLADGTGFEFARPGREGAIRACGARPCDAVEVLEQNGTAWRTVATFSIADDPVKGEMTTPDGVIRYNPDTGAVVPNP